MDSGKQAPVQIPDAALTAIKTGKIVDAIKIIREETGLGLKEAKELVDDYPASAASGEMQIKSGTGLSDDEIPLAAISALQNGSKIEAIRMVREHTNTGLKEAKDRVEQYIKEHPSIQSQLARRQREVMHNLRWLIISILVLGLTYYYLFTK